MLYEVITVFTVLYCVSMCPCFYGTPVISGRDNDCVHTVHDTFIMRGSTIGVRCCEGIGFDDAIAYLLASVTIKG